MKILFLMGREKTYPRNDVLVRALQRLDKVEIKINSGSRAIAWGSINSFRNSLLDLLTRSYDLVLVGFYGHLLMLPVGILSRSPVLFDAFVSTYDTLCFDRGIFAPGSLPGRIAFWLDRKACRLADMVLLDTQLHVDYFIRTFALPPDKVHCLPVGCNEEIFFPRPKILHDNITHILFYSTYLPLHGVETIVRAAALLRAEPALHFKLIGTGQGYAQVYRMAIDLGLKNITFMPSVPLETIAIEIAAADICLGGHFGLSDKANRVIPGKVYQILAMGRPLIAADTPANRGLLTDGITACLCPQDNPEMLAATILKLHRDASLQEQLAVRGRSLYLERCSEAVITDCLRRLIRELTGRL